MIRDTKNAAQCQCLDVNAEQQSRWRQLRPREKRRKKTNTMGVLREDSVDPPIRTENFHSGGATTMHFIVSGTNAVHSFIMRSTSPWKRFVPRDNTTFAYNLADVNGTLHDVVERSVVESAGFFTGGTWLDNISGQRKRSTPTVMLFSVWEYVGRIVVYTFRDRCKRCVIV